MELNRIDVHHHFVTDFYAKAIEEEGGDPSGFPGVPKWSLEDDKAFNAKYGTVQTILSLTAPGAMIRKTPEKRADLARRCNEYLAKVRDEAPHQYGFFAALPSMLDKEEFKRELAYALDELKADGVTVFTRYGPGHQYLGHPDFTDIWDELDGREAVVFVHPTHPVDTTLVNAKMFQPMIQYPFETTITAVDMLMNGVIQSHTRCKVILSHAGGTLPFLISRVASGHESGSTDQEAFLDAARNFYYDVALSGTPNVLSILEDFAKPGHILFGSDFPYATLTNIMNHAPKIETFNYKNRSLREEINYKNALKLFPRLAKYHEAVKDGKAGTSSAQL